MGIGQTKERPRGRLRVADVVPHEVILAVAVKQFRGSGL
jgi:hypothetical protein